MAIKEAEGLEKKLLEAKEEEEKKMVEDTFKASQDYMSFLGSFAPAQVTPALGAAQTAMQMPSAQPIGLQQGQLINFAREGQPTYGYIVGPINPATGLPLSVQFQSSDGSLTLPKYPGSEEYQEAIRMGGF